MARGLRPTHGWMKVFLILSPAVFLTVLLGNYLKMQLDYYALCLFALAFFF